MCIFWCSSSYIKYNKLKDKLKDKIQDKIKEDNIISISIEDHRIIYSITYNICLDFLYECDINI
jgi:hypothetical protein